MTSSCVTPNQGSRVNQSPTHRYAPKATSGHFSQRNQRIGRSLPLPPDSAPAGRLVS